MLNPLPMSPRKLSASLPAPVETDLRRAAMQLGIRIREERQTRRWSIAELARRAGVSPDMVYRIEAGRTGSAQTHARIAVALGHHIEWELVDPRRRADRPMRTSDVVHSAMGEWESAKLRPIGYELGLDEPYQHFQFAGRADLVAWRPDPASLLHIENRTRFPDFQEMAGGYNAKRAYLGAALRERLGRGRWHTETHVIAALWSAEVLHALRLRRESFRALCPDPPAAFAAWWEGRPLPAGRTSSLVVIDPLARGRQRPFIGLDEVLAGARPRHRDYAEVAAALAARVS